MSDECAKGFPLHTTSDPCTAGSAVAVLPVGSFEQHGPALPLATDTLIAVAVARAIARQHEVFELPAIAFGCSQEHAGFPGTVSITASTLIALIRDIRESLRRQGFERLLLVNGHGGNHVLANIAHEANLDGPRVALYPAREDWAEARSAANLATESKEDMHAGELETSVLLSAFPQFLRDGWEQHDHTHDDRRLLTALGFGAFTRSGVIGRPSLATPAKGAAVLEYLGNNAKSVLAVLSDREPLSGPRPPRDLDA